MEYQKAPSATATSTFSKELANGVGGLSGKHVYDGVFGGPVKSGTTKMEDYREIFGGSSNCLIPILDFPERNISVTVDVRSSKPDYSMIFGGFKDADYAVPYEELIITRPKNKKVNNFSSKEARWTPAEARFYPSGPQHSSMTEEKIASSPEVCLKSFDDVKQFNVSYNRSNQGSINGTNGMTHVAQLHSIPAYTCLIDEITPLQKTDTVKPVRAVLNDAHLNINTNEGMKEARPLRKVVSGPQPRVDAINTSISHAKPQKKSSRNKSFSNDISFDTFENGLVTQQSTMSAVVNDAHLNINVNEGTKEARPLRKVVSGPQPRGAVINTSISHAEPQKRSSRNKSFSNDISFDTFEIGLGTQQPTMSPVLDNNGGSMRSMNLKFGTFGSDASEGAAGSYSPPLFDEEIDANSAAATSAAALRKAIVEAEAKMKIAKELMERKRQGLHNRVKLSFNDSLKAERREIKAAEKANRSKEEAEEMHHKVYTANQISGLPENNGAKANHITPEIKNAKKSSCMKNFVGETHSTESKWAPLNILESESEKATNGFYKSVGGSQHRATALEVMLATNVENMKPSAEENECNEKMAGKENMKKPMETDKKFKAFEEAPKEKIERILNSVAAAFKWDIFRNIIKSDEDHHQEENEDKSRVAYDHEEVDRTPAVPYEQERCESMLKRPHEPEEQAKSETAVLDKNNDVKELKGSEDCLKIKKKQTKAHDQEEVENQSNEVLLRKENDTILHEIDQQNGNRQNKSLNWVEYVKEQDDWDHKENEMKENNVPKPEDTEMSSQVHKPEVVEFSFNDLQVKEESEERIKEDCGTLGNENLEEAKENEKMPNQITENEIETTCEGLETERMQKEIHLKADDNNMEVNQQNCRFLENNLEATNDAYKLDENENAGKADEICKDENLEGVQITSEVIVEENDNTMEVIIDSFPKENGEVSEAVEEAHDLVDEDDFETCVQGKRLIGLDGIKKQTDGACLGENELKFDHKSNRYNGMEYAEVCEQEKHIEVVASPLDDNDVSECTVGHNHDKNEGHFASCDEEKWLGTGIECKTLCGLEKQVEETVCELGENGDLEEPEVATNSEDEIYFEYSSDKKWQNNMIEGQANQQRDISEEEDKNIRKTPQERPNQSTDDKEEGCNEPLMVEKRDAGDTLQKKMEMEEKHHERKKETKVREIEKEKERIVVERAIREARERAFAEARERAERAAAEKAASEAHKRPMAEAQERLEKACAEANGKSAVEKASMEAKIKAERAAVERATAEARERALERALSEKAAFKANQAEKFAAEKFSSASRDAGLNSSDQQYKGPGPSSSFKYPSTSSNDGLNGANSESLERCKATLERNQRTAERAAKALAEKNMRDLLAQKEQAERNRLAEILDAEVKRWSSGKERNLRALLSTLQYILGSESGWQPIPLTDLISTAAVKKAYRKATLFVHPDKLQQRGASIQQKYTCEKVFDLLKDAWNKFNAEEW